MAKVTVEGSQTPCDGLPTGVRKTVEYTRRVRGRIRRGYYLLISGPTEDETPSTYSDAAYFDIDDGPVEVVPFVPVEEETEPAEVVVHDHLPGEDAPVEDLLPVPAGNASAPVWLAFLRAVGVDVPVDAEGKTPGRDALKAIWRDHGVG